MIGLMVKKKNIGCREYRESGRFTISGMVRLQGCYGGSWCSITLIINGKMQQSSGSVRQTWLDSTGN